MIIYQSNKERFIKDLISNEIHEIIEATYKLKTGHRVAKNELRSWQVFDDNYLGRLTTTMLAG